MVSASGSRQCVTRGRQYLPAPLDRLLERAKWSRLGPPPSLALAPPGAGARPRVLIAPSNFAGQGAAWAGALEQEGLARTANWCFAAGLEAGFAATYLQPVSINAAPAAFQSEQFQRVADSFDAVLIESGRPLFGRLFGYSVAKEALALQTVGLNVAFIWHGSDVRLGGRLPGSEPRDANARKALKDQTAAQEATAKRRRRAVPNLGLPQLVSTPDLVAQVKDATWCPVVVQTNGLPPAGPVLQREVPRVVHIPSNPLLKGTDLIAGQLRELAEGGRIELVMAENLTHAEVLELYASADVVVDQFRLGLYGVAAVEAMAMGRLVVSQVGAAARAVVAETTGLELPIDEVAGGGIGQGIEKILAEREAYRELAARGPAFAKSVHDGTLSARILARTLALKS
ncbi:MAG: hypothetical protein LBH68_08550 [Bifidobacteriaceae bacterium]|jgi:hypothetical protein|nr:hypothetical protein [Bifidobacteriaceae bacterium]